MLVAQNEREQFTGSWILESIELRQSSLKNPQQEKKIAYTLENIGEISSFDVIIEMLFAEKEETEIEENTETANEPATEKIEDIIITTTGHFQNPIVRFFGSHIEFSDRNGQNESSMSRFEYTFINPEKLLLISNEVFYTKDEKSMKDRLYLTLSRITN